MKENKECKVCKAGGKVKAFFERQHTPLEKGLMVGSSILIGFVLGVLFSPIKKGIAIGSHNGCENTIWQAEKDKQKGKANK